MKITSLQIPANIGYLSEWNEFDSSLPPGKIIVNKVHCGCGMTHYYLTAPMPVILISPRRNLILSKVNDPNLIGIHYFERGDSKVPLEKSIERLKLYVSPNPFATNIWSPKILVTYDSFSIVADVLQEMGLLYKFVLVVDEFSCLFTDARIKGLTDMQLIRHILALPNRTVFISATPIKELYLDETDEFKHMTYVNLEWHPSRLRTISITHKAMKSTQKAIEGIIDNFRQKGYFQQKQDNGVQYTSTEAVFFLNSVSDICKIIKSKSLTEDNTRVICANQDENRKRLKKVNLCISNFPSRDKYQAENKTFTFVTKSSFEGADLYSDTATSYIFSDSNRDCLSLDISIDLAQIIGRCRTWTNPFINDIFLYYKTTDRKQFNLNEQVQLIEDRRRETEIGISENSTPSDLILRKFKEAQERSGYKADYIDVVDTKAGKGELIFNKLVYLSDIRTLEIKSYQYENEHTMMQYLAGNGYLLQSNQSATSSPYDVFLGDFNSATNISKKIQVMFENIDTNPEIGNWIMVDPNFDQYFKDILCILGKAICMGLEYDEREINKRIIIEKHKCEIRTSLVALIMPEKIYSKEYLKKTIQAMYDERNIKIKAKAKDILFYFPSAAEKNYDDGTGKRKKGFQIDKL